MSSKLRVYEVARDLGMDNKSLVALFQSVGVTEVRNHMSAVAPEQVERVKRHLEKQNAEKVVEERIRPTVVKRRVKRASPDRAAAKSSPAAAPAPSAPAAPPPSAPQAAPVVEKPAAKPAKTAPVRRKASPAAAQPAASPVSEPSAAPAPPASAPATPPPAPSEPAAAESKPAAAAPAPAAPVERVEAAEPRAEPPPPVEKAQPKPEKKTGIDVWEGRPGVPMPQAPRSAPRRVQYDAKAGTSGAIGATRPSGPMMRGGRMGRGPRRGLGSLTPKRSGGPPVTQERSDRKKVVKIEGSVGLQTLAGKIGVKGGEVLMKLIGLGLTGVNINSTLDPDTAKIVANEFGWEVEDVAVSEAEQLELAQGVSSEQDEANKKPRPPVVTVMGHVDHGKTSLLDHIRKATVASGEAGGITQHIGAYSVETAKGHLTFLDTPGHAAFTAMRARGARTTDVVILVVAADDGVMPQTKEAIDHAKAASVPIVVAVNKIDKPEAQPERVRRELSDVGLVPEEWGGDTLFCEVSAKTGQGVEEMLESILLQTELLELKANPDKPASGVVVEAQLDRGRGPVATILVQEGTLRRGDVVLAGSAFGKVRAMLDDRGRQAKEAGPSVPVAIVGLNEVPSAGDPVHSVTDLKKAQEIAESRKQAERKSMTPGKAAVSIEEWSKRLQEADQLELKVIVKADVGGSLEAINHALSELSTEKVKVTTVHAGVGAITEGDVNLAVAAKAVIIGFNVRPAGKASSLAQKEKVEIRQYKVIYEVVDDIRAAMEGLLAPTRVEKALGKAEVRKMFRVSKAGTVAGCMVVDGLVRRNASVRVHRDNDMIWEGKIEGLKRFKEDVKEVKEGFDCGISLAGFEALQEGDLFEVYDVEEVRQTL